MNEINLKNYSTAEIAEALKTFNAGRFQVLPVVARICGTCKYWQSPEDRKLSLPVEQQSSGPCMGPPCSPNHRCSICLGLGTCKRIEDEPDIRSDDSPAATELAAIRSYDGGCLVTKRDFGCVLHEPKGGAA